MSPIFVVTFVFLGSIALLEAAATKGAPIECRDSAECSEGQCCTLGAQRYSTPQCSPRRGEGEACRPDDGPRDYNLTYPNNLEVQLHVYYILCTCAEGLFCNREKGGICEKI